MTALVECVPNFSEGRKPETIDAIVKEILTVNTTCVLDRHIDPDHNRSVITFVASRDNVVEAAVKAVAKATQLIDMRVHWGEHPRLGATDVLPFVPIGETTLDECIVIAHSAGNRIARELSIPVFFYESAAMLSERKNLEDVRTGSLELLREQIATIHARVPDLGLRKTHETAGAIAIGARPFLIAFNVVLESEDVGVAKEIARRIRARGGGLPMLKALGFKLHSRKLVQVSMNLVDFRVTGMTQAYEAVEREATRLGLVIESVEIVGLIPNAALDRQARYFEKLTNFTDAKILEFQIAQCK